MADRTEGSIEIAADPADVMAEITDFESYPEWSGEMKRVEIKKRDKQGRGKHVFFEIAAGPIKADYTLAYEYKGDERVSWTFLEGNGLRDLEGSYELEPAGKGRTRVTYRMTIDLAIPVPGFLKRQGEKKIIDVALKGLKKRVESQR